MNIKKIFLIGPLVFMLALSGVCPVWAANSAAAKLVSGDSSIVMDVTYGYDGGAKGGRYVPVNVFLENRDSRPFSGSLQITAMESDYDVYRYEYPIEIEAGEKCEKNLYIPMGNRSDQLFVTVTDGDGARMVHKRLKLNFSFDVPELFVGILSDSPDRLQCWDGVGVDYSMLRTRTVNFDADTFPEDEMGMDLIDVLLISDFRIRDLSETQSQVLIEWVRSGGIMILGTGMRVDDTLGRFAPELLEEIYSDPVVTQIDMGASYAQENPWDAVLEIPCVEFALTGGNIIMSDESQTLLASVPYRKGLIAVAAYDFVDISEFCSQNPSFLDTLLTNVLGENRINELVEAVYSGNSSQYWSIRDMINTGNVRRLPHLGLYIMEILIYVFLAGLGLYVFLRQRNMTDYYRTGVVALSVLFTVIIYLMGSKTRFKGTFYTYARFLEYTQDSVSDTAYMNIRAPYNRLFEAHLTGDYSVKPITQNYYSTDAPESVPLFNGEEDYRVNILHKSDETVVSIQDVPAFEPRYFKLNKVESNTESLGFEGDIEIDQGHYSGIITSRFHETVENCAVIFYGKLIYLGDMEPGESKIIDDLEVLEYPLNRPYQVASYLSGENVFETTDINDDAYIEAVEKTNLLAFYLENFMPFYQSGGRVVGVCQQKKDGAADLILSGDAEGQTVVSSDVSVYSSNDEILYRSALMKEPTVLGGSYNSSNNTLYGADPVTLEYSLGNDVEVKQLIFDYVSGVFLSGKEGGDSRLFEGNIYFYNHLTGRYDMMDFLKLEYDEDELVPYLSSGNTITIKYVYENMAGYNWNILLPMVSIVGREY